MKKIIFAMLALLLAFVAAAQTSSYNLQTNVPLGVSTIAANSRPALPVLLSTTYTTNGVTAVYYATNTIVVSNLFTMPATNWLKATNTFVESNSVTGLATNTWTVLETITNRNPTAYYVTNAAYVTSYYSTNFVTNGVTGIVDTYRTNLVRVTNSATITTNYQTFIYTKPVSFTIVGTQTDITTNTTYGAAFLDVTKSASAAVYIGFKLMGSGTSPVGIGYYPGVDTVSSNTAGPVELLLTANGTGWVSTNINVSVGPFGYLNLAYLTNGNASIVTNLVLKVAQKQNAP